MCLKIHLLITVLLVGLTQTKNLITKKNDCDYNKLEDRLNSLIGYFGYEDNKWPLNDNEMTKLCKAVQRDRIVAMNFADNCLKGLARAVPSAIIFSAGKVSKKTCKSELARIEYIAKGKCGNAGKNGTTECWNQLIKIVSNLKNLEDSKKKIPGLCCSYEWVKKCVHEVYTKVGEPNCSEKNIGNIIRQLDETAKPALDILCNGYSSNDKCVDIWEGFDTTEIAKNYRSFVPPMAEVLESI